MTERYVDDADWATAAEQSSEDDEAQEGAAYQDPAYRRALWIVVILNVGYGIAEMIGGGESTSVTFDVSKLAAGEDYSFFCSFPGHYSLMKGSLTLVD